MENTFNFLATMLEKANAKGAFTLKESTGVFQALAQLQQTLFPQEKDPQMEAKQLSEEEAKAIAKGKAKK